jgi:hypothetical protein
MDITQKLTHLLTFESLINSTNMAVVRTSEMEAAYGRVGLLEFRAVKDRNTCKFC